MKKNIQYKVTFITVFILLASLLSSIGVVNIKSDFFEKDNRDYIVNELANPIISESFNKYGNGDSNIGNDEFIKYSADLKLSSNYYFTKEFRENNPEKIVIQEDDGSTRIFANKKAFQDYLDYNENYQTRIIKNNQKDLEEKETYYTKNSNYTKELNNMDNIYWIKATYKNGKYSIDSNEKEIKSEDDLRRFQFIKTEIENRLDDLEVERNGYEDATIYVPDPVVEEMTANYQIDFNNQGLKARLESRDFIVNFMLKVLISLAVVGVITLIFTTFINYHKAIENKTFTALTDIPIEVYALVYFLAISSPIVGINAIGDRVVYRFSLDFYKNTLYQYAVSFFASLLAMVLVIYLVQILKSIYHEGKDSFVFKKSIIIRIFGAIFKYLKKLVFALFSKYGPTSRGFFIGAYLLFALLGYLITGAIGGGVLIFLVGMLILTGVFYLLHSYFSDLREIEHMADQIAQGNYDIKIDEKKNLYKNLSHSLNTAGDSLSLAIARELKSERMKTELITNVSHDLKTPLTSIINYSQLASEEGASQEDIQKYNKIIFEKSLRLKELIENLFEVSKVNSNNVELKLMDINFSEMVKQMAGEWLDKLDEKNISIVSDIEDDIVLKLDGQQTYRILDNVFSNIYKYALEGTRVYVDLVKHEKCILKIKNISKYPLNISAEELMERFTRGDASRSTEGSGLGLSIASSLTQIQGGKFDIEILGDSFMVEIIF